MKSRRGFALIAALWLLVAISALGLEISLAARTRRLSAINALDSDRAVAAALSAVDRARSRFDGALITAVRSRAAASRGVPNDPLVIDPWHVPLREVTDTLTLGDARAAVRLSDAGAALNVNMATEAELRMLFVALRMDAGKADRLAQTIMDWRDPDDFRRGRGAERDDYIKEGSAVLPTNRPFRALVELRDVMGTTPELYALVTPHLTVHGSGRINLRTADRAVLLSLQGVTEEAVAVILRSRESFRGVVTLSELAEQLSAGARAALLPELPRLSGRLVHQTTELEMVSDGWVTGGPVRRRVTALLVRAGEQSIVVDRRIQ
jgi:type II secretory pathway component PulK